MCSSARTTPKNTNPTFTIMWWMYSGKQDDYVDYDEKVIAENEEEAINMMKEKYRRGKNFKVWNKS